MVAYSFKQRFVEPIQFGEKRQTVRGGRRRHARPGDMLQLYTGMRTKACKRIVRDVLCTSALPVTLVFGEDEPLRVIVAGAYMDPDYFAHCDGFKDQHDLVAFWRAEHAVQPGDSFHGTLIEWDWPPEDDDER